MSENKREMTLDEWCAELPKSHLANRELDALKAESARLREALEKIACRHVTEKPLWWQLEARAALKETDQ